MPIESHAFGRQLLQSMLALVAVWGLFVVRAGGTAETTSARIAAAPAGLPLSKDFTVIVDGDDVPVYPARVAPADDMRRWKAMDDAAHSSEYFDPAAFASFDMSGRVNITVSCPQPIQSAKVLPTSYGIVPSVHGNQLTFALDAPHNLTIEINGNWASSLHLFANPIEENVPDAKDPNVIYFGPGIHEVHQGTVVGSGKTVYIAAGAVVRAIGRGDAVFSLKGDHIALRGRGVIDGTLCPTHSRSLLFLRGQDISVEGVILHDSGHWTLPIRQSDRVSIRNIKILGHRSNSDGIDICNSRDVTVDGCFLRTLDDLVVVKSDKGQGEVKHVVVKNCALWNQVAHALSIGAELRDPISDVLFTDCDVIHDTGREWTLRVYHCDSATVSNVRFENIRIEESKKLISLWIGKAVWSKESERGHIQGVTFKNITAVGKPGKIELKGFDAEHGIDEVKFENVVVNGKPLQRDDVISNSFVQDVRVKP